MQITKSQRLILSLAVALALSACASSGPPTASQTQTADPYHNATYTEPPPPLNPVPANGDHPLPPPRNQAATGVGPYGGVPSGPSGGYSR